MIIFSYQYLVIVLPGVVNDLPQYFEDFCFGEKRTESYRQITVDHPPVEHLQSIEENVFQLIDQLLYTFD